MRKFIDISDRWQEDRQNKSEKLVKSKNNADKLAKIKNYRRQNKTDKDGMHKIKKLKTADKDGKKSKNIADKDSNKKKNTADRDDKNRKFLG